MARPQVFTAATDTGVTVQWESASRSSEVSTVGELRIEVGDGPGGDITVYRRRRGPGSGPLDSEDEVIQQLAMGIEQVVYKKGYAVRDAGGEAEERTAEREGAAAGTAVAAAANPTAVGAEGTSTAERGESEAGAALPAKKKVARRKKRSQL